MRNLDYLEPESLDEALRMLADYGDEAAVFAGGTALLLAMRQRMLAPGIVVALGGLSALRGIGYTPEAGLRIGALSRHSEIARADIVREHYPVLAKVAAGLANPQVRNQGTIGGNLCYGDPATDPPSVLVALDAELEIAGRSGTRRVAMADFLVDYFTTALEPGEILTAIHLPPVTPGRVGHYKRHLRTPAEHRPVANVALTLTERGGLWDDVRLVIGAATPVAQSMARAAAALTGQAITLDLAAEAARIAAEDLTPVSDARGSAAFRRQVVRATVRRIVAEAAGLDWSEAAA
ncbi:FAD binding domain-containing protein [Sinisalibacter aestuarii]|uniref:Carbon monoxide dehydrogenase n=1 Tax=Sinisalibacter aestuarii TaxID=2949426 RepID=A0ABQ5LXH7_9RHOB|nr:xanthine dehydrogenase family protein subunit M [Sinisalibacter aestuarii]GKY89634.1 carbon monoxide dehydrogenase [Sinisalibacter aestuarii]